MKTSAIRHPEGNYLIIRRDWQLRALEIEQKGPKRGNSVECAAEIMSVLEFHYNNRHANRKLREFVERAIASADKKLPPLGDWMPYSYNYLEELLLRGRSQNVVIQALAILVSKGFISQDVPGDIREAYGASITWIRLEVDAINAWIEGNMPKSWVEVAKADRSTPGKAPKMSKAEQVSKSVEILGNFYRHIHGKNASFVLDDSRKKKMRLRLGEGRTLGQCAQAIIGNTLSDFHQARHKENFKEDGGKVYDDIGDHIFGSAKKFEAHVGYAEDRGVTEEKAYEALQAFLTGEPSRYAKKGVKPAQSEQKQQEQTPVGEPENAKRYREFAFQIAAFFTTDVPAPEILEMCQTQSGLVSAGKGLTDVRYLRACIQGATRTFRPEGLSEQMADALDQFAVSFCTLQSVNSKQAPVEGREVWTDIGDKGKGY